MTLSASSTSTVTVDYATADGTATAGPSNTTAISLPATGTSGDANPYPSTITVPTTTTALTDVNVTLTGVNHTWPSDIDILLQGPSGATVVLMSDVGGGTDTVDVNLTFDDDGPSMTSPVTSGTYRPTNNGSGDPFPSPAPSGTPGSELSVFNGTNPSGTWSLYVEDDYLFDSGSISGGWSLTFVPSFNPDYTTVSGTLTYSPGTTSLPLNINVLGDTAIESNETFFVNLSSGVNATILDAQGISTIVNDGSGGSFTDDPLNVGSATLKAVHITELRVRIDALRTGNGLSPFLWTDSTLTVGVTVSKAAHLTDLRTALGEVYTALGQTPPIYTDSAPLSGIQIKAVHISQLRNAVVAVE